MELNRITLAQGSAGKIAEKPSALLRYLVIVLTCAATAGAARRADAQAVNGHQPSGRDEAPPPFVVAARSLGSAAAPTLDGRDTDVAWHNAAVITGFRTFDPIEDGEPQFMTEARLLYDAHSLYIFVRAFDPRPDSIVSLLSRRDVQTASDQIKVMIDSYHDRRSGYEFAVNPAGVKRDYYTYGDAQEDVTWDAVWEVATRIDSLGWTAEFRIPLSQLRFGHGNAADDGAQSFGLMITRDIARTNEHVSWPRLRKSKSGIASQFGTLTGLRDLSVGQRLEVTPYALSRSVGTTRVSTGGKAGVGRTEEESAGADVKMGLPDGLTLDATVNPDFGQVEADPAQLNLTAFETEFDERRPFFVEGAGVFSFGGNVAQLFYPRRIGRAPQLAGLVSDQAVAIPGASAILGAAKVTGRLPEGTSIGLLTALTARETADATVVEPRTAYSVARVSQDFRNGESAVGAMGTAVDRAVSGESAVYLRARATAGGLDVRHRFHDATYSVAASFVASSVAGSAAAITRTQQSTVHLYNRPDAGLPYDTTRTTLTGTSLSASADRVAGALRGGLSYQRISPGFEINDIGYLSQADQQTVRAYVTGIALHPHAFWRNADGTLILTNQFTASGVPTTRVPELDVFAELRNAARVSADLWVDNAGAVYCDRCARGGPAVRLSPATNLLVSTQGDPRKTLQPSVAAIYTVGDGGRSTLWRVRPYLIARVKTNISWELGARYQRNRDNTQWYDNAGTAPGTPGGDTTHYLFAHLDQHLLSFTARLNYTATPTLSLQLYAEPFVTTGAFSNVRELGTPRAAAYDARFRPYALTEPDGFNTKQFRSDAVLRWEYRPGSTVFVVWTQGRDEDGRDPGSFAPRRDYRNLFTAHPENTVLLKASYWFGL